MSDQSTEHKRYGAYVLLARSAIMLAAGIYGLNDPEAALRLLVVISAMLLVADGMLGLLADIFRTPTINLQFNDVVRNVLEILAGILIFSSQYVSPEVTPKFIITVVGLLGICAGLVELYIVYKYRSTVDRFWPSVFTALAHLGVGIVLLAMPSQSALQLINIVSILLIVYACALLAVAWYMLRSRQPAAPRQAPAPRQ
ncbi:MULTISPECIES: DUF308 domain-containing protein [unclassified Devosia]|uniref:HdeD family acid-resistance protein n=1 Tax=unclassified Devosia TaxID=196773 RepID=UPI001557D44C|nr:MULTISPECIES: DUF308 domain-containing protein [unclassified Devosia]